MKSFVKSLKIKEYSIIPGFGLTTGFTILYISFLILIPLSMVFINSSNMGWDNFWKVVTEERVLASFKITFGAAFIATLINTIFGLLLAWTLVRYDFVGRKIIDAIIDLPFALPTAVAGITLTTLYSQEGWIGKYLNLLGIKVSFSFLGIVVALSFVGFPFVVRTVQPVLLNLDKEFEEAASTLGATRIQTFIKVIFPEMLPALLTGFSLAFSRTLGEYGSVVFISGNMPMKTEISPLIIMTKLEQYDYSGATAVAAVMLIISFIMLFIINLFQWWNATRHNIR
ncbi:sulfate transport system permease protein CysT [Gottschalkia purinilytica]|uniref:Sulfate transport system permease protein CysT n=1 Tax=Gottschalkia purinilytica TaxID=1503 RepID=A0A0L0WA27_GOTPU|nr:sulfate ABC transporter permease subunit CysT [Gottschalkia purinilytica]KNF08316.1 sulfate transport system permease protein CysT [Gottschalkia purinilytica]